MLIYVGRGAAIPDIPARDLTDEEVERCGGEQKLVKTGLYRKPAGDGSGEGETQNFASPQNPSPQNPSPQNPSPQNPSPRRGKSEKQDKPA